MEDKKLERLFKNLLCALGDNKDIELEDLDAPTYDECRKDFIEFSNDVEDTLRVHANIVELSEGDVDLNIHSILFNNVINNLFRLYLLNEFDEGMDTKETNQLINELIAEYKSDEIPDTYYNGYVVFCLTHKILYKDEKEGLKLHEDTIKRMKEMLYDGTFNKSMVSLVKEQIEILNAYKDIVFYTMCKEKRIKDETLFELVSLLEYAIETGFEYIYKNNSNILLTAIRYNNRLKYYEPVTNFKLLFTEFQVIETYVTPSEYIVREKAEEAFNIFISDYKEHKSEILEMNSKDNN